MYLPTTFEGMNCAIGQYIHGVVAANIQRESDAAAARAAVPGYVAEPFVWSKASVPAAKKSDAQAFADYLAGVRARQAAA